MMDNFGYTWFWPLPLASDLRTRQGCNVKSLTWCPWIMPCNCLFSDLPTPWHRVGWTGVARLIYLFLTPVMFLLRSQL